MSVSPPEASGRSASVALVTGSSRGIGRATAHALAAAGFEVVLHGATKGSAGQTADELAERYGADPLTLHADVSDSAAVAAMFRQVFERYRRLDALVVSAGVHEAGPLGMTTDATLSK